MTLPNITDQVRINPPFASVVSGRTPLLRWHDTYNGARRSALGYNNTRQGSPDKGEERYAEYVTRDVGIAVVTPTGSVEYVDTWAPGQMIERKRR
jgi:hypothetical protein